jgi:myo-inositol-1-phosphate synthase
MTESRIGIWWIGAKGGVATTATVGLLALQKRLIDHHGLATDLPQFQQLGLTAWDRFVVAGHEIRSAPLYAEALRLANESRTASHSLIEQCRDDIERIDARIRPGTVQNVGPTIAALADDIVPAGESPCEIVARLRRDFDAFISAEGLARLIVVNVASTEPPIDASALPADWPGLERLLDSGAPCCLPASSLYAIAALGAGHCYINFTPSLGPALPAIDELARLRGACYYGCDGKTGETLMKSVLAPMFARRNLRVLSWVGHNIFGNLDARVLDDPANKKAKLASKDHLIGDILGYQPSTLVSIENVPDLGDWKTAWDHIHFAGFLGVPMTLQFIWQGCDSVLAAPLALDLVRLTDFACRRGHRGAMPFLAGFFKSPYGVQENAFDRQFQMLEEWMREGGESRVERGERRDLSNNR